MWLTQKCLNLLRLKQICKTKLVFWKPLTEQISNIYPEQNVINYLKSWNKDLKQDEYGNLYLINPWTPLLSAHMDTVQREDDTIWMPHIHINKKKWTISYDNSIIGWDDKCGIALAMQLYEKYWNSVSLLFSRQEEVGHLWASDFCRNHSDLLLSCKYCLVLDRRNAWDIISSDNGYCSKEFEDEIHRCTKDFWYKPTHWLLSDADAYSKYINCVNLSVWYYNAHTSNEYIVIEELKNAFNAVCNIIENFQGEYDIYHEPEKKTYYGWYNYYSWYWHSSYYGGDWNKEYDWSRSNSWDKWESKKKEEDKYWWSNIIKWMVEKKDDWFSEEADKTRKLFKVRKSWKLEVKDDVFLVDPEDPYTPYSIPKWVFAVMDWEEYSLYEDQLYWEDDYNNSFNPQLIQDGIDETDDSWNDR